MFNVVRPSQILFYKNFYNFVSSNLTKGFSVELKEKFLSAKSVSFLICYYEQNLSFS